MKKIKVLHIITRLILGGAQENTLFTVEGLERTGKYDVRLLTGPPLGPEGELLNYCQKKGIKYNIFSQLRRNISPLRDATSFFELVFFLKKNKFDIVHTHSSKAGIIGRLAAHYAKTPVIIHTVHGLPFHDYQSEAINKFYISLERKAAKYTDNIFCVAKAMIEKCVKNGIASRDKFSLVRSGFRVEPFLYAKKDIILQRKLGISPDDIVIGKVARLFDLKGHKYLIAAFRDVLKKHPNAKLLLVGDGILKETLMAQAEELGIRERIIFAGLVPAENVADYIALMDILAHTSLREGLAKVIPQALLMSKPVVSFDIDGAGELIVDKTTGMLTKPENINELADAINYLIENKAEANMMAIRGKKLALSLYPVERMVSQIDELYTEILEQKGINA
jgi:glycosyltransferase involved in cell wall biosynthesis